MWLINTETLRLKQFIDSASVRYGIFSHTWGEEEISFQDWKRVEADDPQAAKIKLKAGYVKIIQTCHLAASRKLEYAWIDTCCIDKSSSAELSEAINSMFKWYRDSDMCFVYLADLQSTVGTHSFPDSIRRCRWFRRSWTLQELIAPKTTHFYDQDWNQIGEKSGMYDILTSITNIDTEVLADSSVLSVVPVGRRMSWAARRGATRVEDIAYSLMGIFDVTMPLLYGEGPKAFLRLQEEILQISSDLSLFAWEKGTLARSHDWTVDYEGMFAESPAYFLESSSLRAQNAFAYAKAEMQVTNFGIRLEACFPNDRLDPSHSDLDCDVDLNCCRKEEGQLVWLSIALHKREQDYFRFRRLKRSATRSGLISNARSMVYVAKVHTFNGLRDERMLRVYQAYVKTAMESPLHHIVLNDGIPLKCWDPKRQKFSFQRRSFWTGVVPITFHFNLHRDKSSVRIALICTNERSVRAGAYLEHNHDTSIRGALFREFDPESSCSTELVKLAHRDSTNSTRKNLSEAQRLTEIQDILFVNFADNFGCLGDLSNHQSVVLRKSSEQGILSRLRLEINSVQCNLHYDSLQVHSAMKTS